MNVSAPLFLGVSDFVPSTATKRTKAFKPTSCKQDPVYSDPSCDACMCEVNDNLCHQYNTGNPHYANLLEAVSDWVTEKEQTTEGVLAQSRLYIVYL